MAQDPVISRVKLIAEPWDVGQVDSYDVGRVLPAVVERVERPLPRRHAGLLEEPARPPRRVRGPLDGSADLYRPGRRRALASVNFITVHDGFTLPDVVTYNEKHNEANGEQDRDGSNDNRSWNWGRGKASPTTRPSLRFGTASDGPCSPPWSCPSACPSCSAATSSAREDTAW